MKRKLTIECEINDKHGNLLKEFDLFMKLTSITHQVVKGLSVRPDKPCCVNIASSEFGESFKYKVEHSKDFWE